MKISAKIDTDWTLPHENLPLLRENLQLYEKKTTKQIFPYGLNNYVYKILNTFHKYVTQIRTFFTILR